MTNNDLKCCSRLPTLLQKGTRRGITVASVVIGACLTSACMPTLHQQFIDPSDACASARLPIVQAGDEIDQKLRKQAHDAADQQAQARQQANPEESKGILGALSEAVKEMKDEQNNYEQLLKAQSGADAAKALAEANGNASNDRAQLQSVTQATKALRECRSRQIAAIQSFPVVDTATLFEKKFRLTEQQRLLTEDDTLINRVFGEYARKAATYNTVQAAGGGGKRIVALTTSLRNAPSDTASVVASVSKGTQVAFLSNAPQDPSWSVVDMNGTIGFLPASALRRPVKKTVAKAPAVDALQDDQTNAQFADKKESDSLHQTIQNALASGSPTS